jgi:carboxymethylenebutenolidase
VISSNLVKTRDSDNTYLEAKMMMKIKATDGSGTFDAYTVYPAKTPAAAVVVIQEIFGINDNMRAVCERIAGLGFIAICPDLFWRQEPGIQLTDKTEAEWKRAFELYNGFNVEQGIEDLKSTLAAIRGDAKCTGKAGTIGYCLGGRLAYQMATRSDADCNVSYYGVGIETLLDESRNITKPLLMHIAEKDKFVPPAAQAKIIETLQQNKKVEIHVYAGMDHAFTRINGQHYDEKAAKEANDRTAAFLKRCLA